MQNEKSKVKKRKTKVVAVRAKKKTAVARAVITEGKGIVKINNRLLDTIQPEIVRDLIREPIVMAEEFGSNYDISINVKGGGFMSQTSSARTATAKALVAITKNKNLRQKFMDYDRMLLIDDHRRKEPKKPLGKGARKKKQTSYR